MFLLHNILRFLFNYSTHIIGRHNPTVHTTDHYLNRRLIRIYQPPSIIPTATMIYYHGGGWLLGSIKAYDRVLRDLCLQSNCLVIAGTYRQPPEHKFPIAIDDAYEIYMWVLQYTGNYDNNLSKIILCGDSAGGNLVINILRRLHLNKQQMPELLVLIYPLLTNKINIAAHKFFDKIIATISDYVIRYCLKQYIADKNLVNSPDIAVVENFDKTVNYPPTLIIKANSDALNKSIDEFSQLLRNTSKIKVISYPNTLHGFINFNRFSTQARLAAKHIGQFITANLH